MPTQLSVPDHASVWHAQSSDDALRALSVSAGSGLSRQEAIRRLQQYGRNSLPTPKRRGPWLRLALQFHNPLIYVLLESGARVPADLRLLRVKNLRVNEAALTGESVAVEKGTEPVGGDASIGDRSCMAYAGTVVGFGQAHGLVVRTGEATEMGHIGKLVGEVQTLVTPLTRRLDQFARQITLFILAAGLITFLYGHFVRQMPVLEIFLAVVGLAVAAIPEGLPAVVTIVLAIGTRAMARNNAVIRRSPAVETLGSVTVICSDKTGTLTKNEMTAVRVMLPTRTLEVSGAGYAPEGGFRSDGVAVARRGMRRCKSWPAAHCYATTPASRAMRKAAGSSWATPLKALC